MERHTQKPARPRVVVGPVKLARERWRWRLLTVGAGIGAASLWGWEDAIFMSYTQARKALAWFEETGGDWTAYKSLLVQQKQETQK